MPNLQSGCRPSDDPNLVGELARNVASSQQIDGGFSDAGGPSDVVTTLAAATLLAQLDPDFDPTPTSRWLADRQDEWGWWHGYGPETTWLTVELVTWLGRSSTTFAERFAWPHAALAERDRRTGLPFYGYYTDLHRLFSEVAGLSQPPSTWPSSIWQVSAA